MAIKLKNIKDQVIVITGASSGIGLATAKLAVARGARVVLSSRNLPELERIAEELNKEHGKDRICALAVAADVANPDEVEQLAQTTIREFGGFDTWINNAGLSIYGKLWDVPLAEKRRLFDINFWGVVHGCRSALKHLKTRGGSIINLGSAVSERSIPLQGIYSASKHAIKGYTDSLRVEIEIENWPVSVTLVRPSGIDTPYPEHARNHMEFEPTLPSPIYAPEIAAKGILAAAATPHRDVFIGGASKAFEIMDKVMPTLTDNYMKKTLVGEQQKSERSNPNREDALFGPPRNEGRVHGNSGKYVMKHSLYTASSLHPLATLMISALTVGAIGIFFSQRNRLQTLGDKFDAATEAHWRQQHGRSYSQQSLI